MFVGSSFHGMVTRVSILVGVTSVELAGLQFVNLAPQTQISRPLKIKAACHSARLSGARDATGFGAYWRRANGATICRLDRQLD